MVDLDDLRKEAENLQRCIDLHSAMCLAVANNTDPDVMRNRIRLENSLKEARNTLRKLQRRLV